MAEKKTKTQELLEAILAGDLARLLALLKRGSGANAEISCDAALYEKMGFGHQTDAVVPLLVAAAAFGRADMVAALLEHGAEVGKNSYFMSYVVVSANEQTRFEAMDALGIATRNKHRDVIELLKAHGA